MRHHAPHIHGQTILCTALAVAALTRRSRRVVERHCIPLACDTVSGMELYDVAEAETDLAAVERRHATRRRADAA